MLTQIRKRILSQYKSYASGLVILLLLGGCGIKRLGHNQGIPNCVGALVFVGEDCYVPPNKDKDYIEVRCPKSTTKYMKCHDVKEEVPIK